LLSLKADNLYVFAAFAGQLRRFHAEVSRLSMVRNVAEFEPANLGNWFYRRIARWSKSLPGGRASTHIFRRKSLQHTRSGEDPNRQVASDARPGVSVMLTTT
jgi:hypothetical protein